MSSLKKTELIRKRRRRRDRISIYFEKYIRREKTNLRARYSERT